MRQQLNLAILLAFAVVLIWPGEKQLTETAFTFGVLCCVAKVLVRRR